MDNEQRKYWFFGSKLNSVLLLILIILMIFALRIMYKNQEFYKQNLGIPSNSSIGETLQYGEDKSVIEYQSGLNTYTYTNHGFSIELPKGFVPKETQGEGGPGIHISLPGDSIVYYPDALYWDKYVLPSYSYLKDEKIGETVFKAYSNGEFVIYWYQKGNVGYELWGNKDSFKTFKFIGWPQSTTLPKYMGTMASGAGWPPVISVSTNTYSCNPGVSNEVSTVVEKIINGKKYCVSSFVDAAAGSRGGEYTYIKKEGNGTKIASFSLRWPSCGVYGGPGDSQYDQCSNNQTVFFGGLDSLIDNLMK